MKPKPMSHEFNRSLSCVTTTFHSFIEITRAENESYSDIGHLDTRRAAKENFVNIFTRRCTRARR